MAEQLSKIPQARISSLGVTSFAGGLDQRGEANITADSFSAGQNAMVTSQGLITHRLGKRRWLPDSQGVVYEVFSALDDSNSLYYIIADNGKIRYIKEGGTAWINAGGDNTVTTTGTVNTFIRVEDKVVILNGEDRLGYFDIKTKNVVHFNFVADPTQAPTGTVVGGITGTTQKVYYAIWYSSTVGSTKASPILTQQVGKIREQWAKDGSQGVTITDPNTRPTGAVSWNVGLATAPAGGTIQPSDILPIALGLDINTNTFFDNGSITQLTNAGTAPEQNSTEGPRARYGKEIDGRPFLYGIKGEEHAVLIGGNDGHAMEFNEGVGGYKLQLNKGTNFYPKVVTGFRNGQGIPSITVLFSNTEGLSKQSIVEQNTISLGTFSATVWGSTEQNYGAAGVSSPYGPVNYKGRLVLPTTDGFLELDTDTGVPNVLSANRITDPVIDEVGSIKTELLDKIVGTAWANRMLFTIPSRGFDYNNVILVYDVTAKQRERFYTFDIPAQWIGTVSPPGEAGFVYISQDNHFFKLEESFVAQDESSTGVMQPFPVEVKTALIGTNPAHDGYYAVVQAMFYLDKFIGSVDLTVYWRDYQSGRIKSKTRTVVNGTGVDNFEGGWDSPGYLFSQDYTANLLSWGAIDTFNNSQTVQKDSIQKPIPMDVVTNEMQAEIKINSGGSGLVWRSVSFEGQALGINPALR